MSVICFQLTKCCSLIRFFSLENWLFYSPREKNVSISKRPLFNVTISEGWPLVQRTPEIQVFLNTVPEQEAKADQQCVSQSIILIALHTCIDFFMLCLVAAMMIHIWFIATMCLKKRITFNHDSNFELNLISIWLNPRTVVQIQLKIQFEVAEKYCLWNKIILKAIGLLRLSQSLFLRVVA